MRAETVGMWEKGREQRVSGHDGAHDQAQPPTLQRKPKCQDHGKSDPSWGTEKKREEDNL